MLKVLVGGWPGSGTSFLTNLIIEMGFSPGSLENLKGADKYNRWGYFEHVPIREVVWQVIEERGHGTPREYSSTGFFRESARVVENHPAIAEITEIARADNVGVFKTTALPLVWWLFPPSSKHIIIERPVEETFHRRAKRAKRETFRANYLRYRELVAEMDGHVLVVQYDDFKKDFDEAALTVARFLRKKVDVAMLRDIFKPRSRWA